jgi:hypothetical protein
MQTYVGDSNGLLLQRDELFTDDNATVDLGNVLKVCTRRNTKKEENEARKHRRWWLMIVRCHVS